ncbi:hypothetical protein JMG10_08135 [Nostoc ellipsosporum NOK]|nr:hypothetical protein [Nostoc ellipsosporum NOK]
MTRFFPFLLLVLIACNNDKQPAPQPAKDSTVFVNDTAATPAAATDPFASIGQRVEYINTQKLETKHFEFTCDEKTKVDYFYDKGEIVKIAIDFGWIGDVYAREGYYYDRGKLVFIYEYVESGPACDDCIETYEYRSYVVNDKVVKYTKDQKDATCRSRCAFNASSRHYQLLQATTTEAIKAMLCR